jgi:hypothetical protein
MELTKGDLPAARRNVAMVEDLIGDGQLGMAMVHIALGERDLALEELDALSRKAQHHQIDAGFINAMNLKLNFMEDPALKEPGCKKRLPASRVTDGRWLFYGVRSDIFLEEPNEIRIQHGLAQVIDLARRQLYRTLPLEPQSPGPDRQFALLEHARRVFAILPFPKLNEL